MLLPAVDRLNGILPEDAVLNCTPSRVTDTDVAPVDNQLIVTLSLTSGLTSVEDMLAVGAGTADQVTVTDALSNPPGPVTDMTNVSLPALDRLNDLLPEDAVLN